jgi:hypothetical protein
VADACPLSCCKCGDCQDDIFCSESTPDCCDLVSQETTVSNYGNCLSYKPGEANADHCGDAVIADFANLGGTVGEVCKASCNQCGAPFCIGDCCDLTSPAVPINNYGGCGTYQEGQTNEDFCNSDKTSGGVSVAIACKASCKACNGVATSCNADGSCCDATPPGTAATPYGACDKYSAGGEYENFCSQDTSFPEYGGGLVQDNACKFSCGNCGGGSTACTGSCCDSTDVVSIYGGCKEYALVANQPFCSIDKAALTDEPDKFVQDFCPVTCGICTPSTGNDDCTDSTDPAVSPYGSCQTYAENQPNHIHCATDGMDQIGKCPIACKVEACLNSCSDKESGFVSDFGDCNSYASGNSNAGFCSDKVTQLPGSGYDTVAEACPLSCGTC